MDQLRYNGTKIIKSLKLKAFKTSITTVLRAFCYGVATFVPNPKYSQVLGPKEDVEEGLQGPEVLAEDLRSVQVRMMSTAGPIGQRLSEGSR